MQVNTRWGSGWTLISNTLFDSSRVLDAAKDVVKAAAGMPESDEIAAGRNQAGRVLGMAPLINDTGLQRYVNQVGRWLASQSERPALPWTFGVVESSAVFAFAGPGGYVLITRGLYDLLENEAQLAGVLAHEISHVSKRHHISMRQTRMFVRAGIGLVAPQAQSPGMSAVRFFEQIFLQGLYANAEREADALALLLAARSGYAPHGLIQVLEKLTGCESQGDSLHVMNEVYPSPPDRLRKLTKLIEVNKEHLPDGGLTPRLRSIAAAAGRARGADETVP